MNPNPAEKMMDRLVKCGWVKGFISVDSDDKNSKTSVEWTEEGKALLKQLAVYKSFGPVSPDELRVLLDFASQIYNVQHRDPPRN